MFDSSQEIGITLETDQGPKKIDVRYPSDAEWSNWRRRKKVLRQELGRGNYQVIPPSPGPADLALVETVRVDKGGPPIDEDEALEIINRLAASDVRTRPTRESGGYRIEMRVLNQHDTVHVLKIPSIKDKRLYNSTNTSVVYGQYNHQEFRINYQAGGDLYDKLVVSTDGYAGPVPINHKSDVIGTLMKTLDAAEQESANPDDDLDQ